MRPDVWAASFLVPAVANELPRARKDFERVELAGFYGVAAAVDSNLLGGEPNPHQWSAAKNVVSQSVGEGGVLLIHNVDINGDDLWLYGEATAKIGGRLIVANSGYEISLVPLSAVKPRPASHRWYLVELVPGVRAPPALSQPLGDGSERDWRAGRHSAPSL
jgi:hypothetical protein